jgi:hypothetical protein
MAPEPEKRRSAKRSDWINPRHVTKLTPEIQAEICGKIAPGSVSIRSAATSSGVSYESVKTWIRRGASGEEPYASFARAVECARGQAEVNLSAKALAGGKGSSVATWMLERRFREDYGPVNRLEHSGPDGGPIAHTDITKVSDEDLEKIIKGE